MIPELCVLLLSLVGTWMLIDPVPALIILNFPEVIGRLAFALFYVFITRPPFPNVILRVFGARGYMWYMQLIMEAAIMEETPLGGWPEEEEDDS